MMEASIPIPNFPSPLAVGLVVYLILVVTLEVASFQVAVLVGLAAIMAILAWMGEPP